ncbi:hypothetical protein [Mesobacillus zeae]|nr:hypothetical protein [Mesobacillus zeae]
MVEIKVEISHSAKILLTNEKIRTLLIYSENAKQYEFLNSFAINFQKAKSEEVNKEISDWSSEQVLLTNDLLDRIVNSCRDEWKGSTHPFDTILEEEKRVPCDLCGYPRLKELFYIENKLNQKKLIVGSKCIEEFPNIEYPGRKGIKQIKKEMSEQSKLKEITLAIPGIEREIEQWDKELHKFDILIPLEIEQRYLEIGEFTRELFQKYLAGKVSKQAIEDIKHAKQKKEIILNEMKIYSAKNKDSIFVATNKIIRWLEKQNKLGVIKKLKITGFIDENTIQEITEPNFIEHVSRIFAKKINYIGKLDFHKEENEFMLSLNNFDIKLYFGVARFMEYFGATLLEVKPKISFTEINIFKIGKIRNRNCKNNTLIQMARLLNGFEVEISFNDYGGRYDYLEQNVIDLYDKRVNKVLEEDLNWFINQFKPYAFVIDQERLRKEVLNFVNSHPNKRSMLTKDELRDIRLSRFKDNSKEEEETD